MLTLPKIIINAVSTIFLVHCFVNSLDFSTKETTAVSLQSIQSFESMKQLKQINLTNRVIPEELFEEFVRIISNHPSIVELHLSKSLYSQSQIEKLQRLASSKKRLKIIDSEGGRFGAIYMDWHEYNIKKQDAHLSGIRETTEKALEYFQTMVGMLPEAILDFGCGTGQDTIPLLKLLPNCHVVAVDGDEEALQILQSHLSDEQRSRISVVKSPFMEMKLMQPVDLFIASFTWPYRPPDQFAACWKKTIDSVKDQGILAGHFFGPIRDGKIDPGLTYHTEAELKTLLANSGCEIIWFKEEKEGTKFNIIAGDGLPSWGSLFHVVAKVNKN